MSNSDAQIDPSISKEAECLKICPEIIPRRAWRPRKPKKAHKHQTRAWYPVLFKSSNTYECTTKEQCLKNAKWMQTYHMEIHGFPDIAFAFLIGEDGQVYEGRGWGVANERAEGYVGIAYMGYYCWDADHQPTKAMRRAAYRLVLCGIHKGFIKSPFKKGIKTVKNGLPDPEMWDKYMPQNDGGYVRQQVDLETGHVGWPMVTLVAAQRSSEQLFQLTQRGQLHLSVYLQISDHFL